MKRIAISRYLLLCILSAMCLACCITSTAQKLDSIIQNGGFEDGLALWEVFNARLDTSPSAARSGNACCTGWVMEHHAKHSFIRQHLQLEPGAEYEITFWARSDGQSVGTVWADFATESDNRLLLATKKIPTDWTEYKLTFRARRPDTTLDFHIPQTWVGTGATSGPKAGRAWIDDISVRRTDSPIQFPPKPWTQEPGPNETAFDPENGYDIAPSIVQDNGGKLYIAWLRNLKSPDGGEITRQEIMLRSFDGNSWSRPVVIAGGRRRCFPPAIAGTSRGVWIAWSEEKPNGIGRVLAQHWQTDGTPRSITVADDSSNNRAVGVSVDKAGSPWFAWETSKDGLSGVAVRTYDLKKGSFGKTTYPSKHTGNGQYPATTVDHNGGVWVAWSAFVGTDYQLWVQKIGSKPVRLSTYDGDNLHPTFAAGRDRLWIAWNTSTRHNPKQKPVPGYDVDRRYYAYRHDKGIGIACCADGEKWYLPPALAESNVEQPCMAITGSGAPLLLYRTLDAPAKSDGWLTRGMLLGADGWKMVDIGLSQQGLSAPASAVTDASGNVWIAQQQDSRVNGGYFQRLDGESWISVRKIPSPAMDTGWQKALQKAKSPESRPVVDVPAHQRRSITYNGKTYKLYFGDLHLHTDFSTCAKRVQGFQDDSLKTGCYAGLLDFAMFADHGEHMNQNDWCIEKAILSANNVPGTFVTFSGEEWTSQMVGHKNIVYLGMDGRRFDSRKTEVLDLWKALQEGKAITIPHHPADAMHTTDWDYYDPRFQKLVEIFQARLSFESPDAPCVNEKSNVLGSYVSDGLARGYRMGFIAGPDHPGKYGVAAVYATDLTREAIFDALLNKRCYASVEPTAFLDFRVDGRLMGETVAAEPRKSPHRITVHVETEAPIESLVLIRNGKQICDFKEAVGKKKIDLTYVDEHPEDAPIIGTPPEKTVYYYVRVVEQGKRSINAQGKDYQHISWSSPVWITLDPEPSGVSSYKVLGPSP